MKLPLLFITLQLLQAAGLIWKVADILQPADTCALAFWSLTLAVLLLHAILSERNPGFLASAVVPPPSADPNAADLLAALTDDREKKIQELCSVGEHRQVTTHGAHWCRLCNIPQPSRTKHCHECERCVLTYDHHCVFVGNCIGEKNRPFLYFYLLLLAAQSLLATLLIEHMFRLDKLDYWLFAIFAGQTAYFTLVTVFFAFHNYLMCKGLTTWEYFSDEILLATQGSRGDTENLAGNCCYNLKMYWASAFLRGPAEWVAKKPHP